MSSPFESNLFGDMPEDEVLLDLDLNSITEDLNSSEEEDGPGNCQGGGGCQSCSSCDTSCKK